MAKKPQQPPPVPGGQPIRATVSRDEVGDYIQDRIDLNRARSIQAVENDNGDFTVTSDK